jgi:TRAP-type C4-dicarboxylate transport system substrate-binding protein
MRKRGVKLLVALDNGSPIVVSNTPLTSPSAFRGKTVRVYDKPTGEIIRTLGGAPSTITVSDVYPALQRGTVMAALGGLEGAIGLKEYEVSKYLLDPNGLFGLLINGYVMNLHSFENLPEDLRKVVIEAANEAGRTANEAMIHAFQVQLKEMESHGMKVTVLKPGTPSYKAFQKALAPLARQDEKRFPPGIVQAVLKAER